jgi:hypothetical protein
MRQLGRIRRRVGSCHSMTIGPGWLPSRERGMKE